MKESMEKLLLTQQPPPKSKVDCGPKKKFAQTLHLFFLLKGCGYARLLHGVDLLVSRAPLEVGRTQKGLVKHECMVLYSLHVLLEKWGTPPNARIKFSFFFWLTTNTSMFSRPSNWKSSKSRVGI